MKARTNELIFLIILLTNFSSLNAGNIEDVKNKKKPFISLTDSGYLKVKEKAFLRSLLPSAKQISTDYLLRDGSLAMTGHLNLNNWNIVGVTSLAANAGAFSGSVSIFNNGYREILLRSASNSLRWALYSYGVDETGSNNGGDFYITRYDDGGNFLSSVMHLSRKTGETKFNGNVTAPYFSVNELDQAFRFNLNTGWNGWARALISVNSAGNIGGQFGAYGDNGGKLNWFWFGKNWGNRLVDFNVEDNLTKYYGNVAIEKDNPQLRINNNVNPNNNTELKLSWSGSDTHGLTLRYHPNNAVAYIDNTYPIGGSTVWGSIKFRRNIGGTFTDMLSLNGLTGDALFEQNITNGINRSYISRRSDGISVGAVGHHSDNYYYIGGHPSYGPGAGNDVRVRGFGSNLLLGTNQQDVVSIFSNATVGIGVSTTGGYKLAVNGDIKARKLRITQTDWSDYVFEPDYVLKPLSEVEAFIQKNKHLPEVPSAKQVAKNGLDLGETQALLLKKIEELTLYVIELKKEINQLKETKKK